MMDKNYVNRCTFRGKLGSEPQTVEINGGSKTTFSMAMNKTNGRGVRSVLWARFEYWRKDAKKVQELNLKKGDDVRVDDAEWDKREYTKDGTKKYWDCFQGGVVSLVEAD
jgi:single-stranded DNA-binding protein